MQILKFQSKALRGYTLPRPVQVEDKLFGLQTCGLEFDKGR